MQAAEILPQLWSSLIWPLIRLICFISVGLLIANFIEALNWTSRVAALARPLTRFGNLSPTAGASFSMAFFSGIAANTMLSEAYEKKILAKKELVLSNLFNSLPTYFLHLPTLFFITVPLIKSAALVYVGITFGAAIFRTVSIVVLGHFLLPATGEKVPGMRLEEPNEDGKIDWRGAWEKGWRRFRKRIRRIVLFTVPIYIIIFLMHRIGYFKTLEMSMAEYLSFFSWLTPESMGIITLHIAAEFTAGLAAAGALLQEGTMSSREIILALVVGNVLSSPVRAIRHQFPYYTGIFPTRIAVELIVYNQLFRITSLVLMGYIYFIATI